MLNVHSYYSFSLCSILFIKFSTYTPLLTPCDLARFSNFSRADGVILTVRHFRNSTPIRLRPAPSRAPPLIGFVFSIILFTFALSIPKWVGLSPHPKVLKCDFPLYFYLPNS